MNAQAEHAREAANRLATVIGGAATQIKPSNAKVALGKELKIILTDAVAQRFKGERVHVTFNTQLVAGKLVVEVKADESNGRRTFSPFRSGEKIISMPPEMVQFCGPSFPKFGMCPPDSVIWARDNVLRITLPGKRPSLQPRVTKMAKPKTTEAKPKSEVKPKSEEPKKVDQITDHVAVSDEGDVKTFRHGKIKGVAFANSSTSVRLHVNDLLARCMETKRYDLKDITVVGEGKTRVTSLTIIASPRGRYRLGKPLQNGAHFITLNDNEKFRDERLMFRVHEADEVVVRGEGEEITASFRGEIKAPIVRHPKRKKKEQGAESATAPLSPNADPFTALRHLRDELNKVVESIKSSGDDVTLYVRDNGQLGFRYEG